MHANSHNPGNSRTTTMKMSGQQGRITKNIVEKDREINMALQPFAKIKSLDSHGFWKDFP